MELPLERDFAGNYGEVKALEAFRNDMSTVSLREAKALKQSV